MRNREDPSSRADDPGRALADLAPPIPPERLDVEAMDSLSRRRHLSPIAKDIERNIGRLRRHEDAGRNRELLGQGTGTTA